MRNNIIVLLLAFLCVTCKKNTRFVNNQENRGVRIENKYATGFEVIEYEGFTVVELNSPWPNADKKYTYLLVNKGVVVPKNIVYDAIVQVPVEKIVVTSTTHIPSLEALGVLDKLIGFPNTEFISSPVARKRIDLGVIQDLGNNESINTEVLLNMEPDVVIGFALNGKNKTYNTIQKSGIPVMYNAAWIENHALGRAEWIKFFGCIFKKEKEAAKIFTSIVTDYNIAKKLAMSVSEKPTVLAGSMFKDIWNIPYGNSWAGQFIADAGGDYLWAETEGAGSLSLNIESVLEKAQQANYWITLGAEKTKEALSARNVHYKQFDAFQKNNIYIANRTGETGGLLFYELGPNRPDLILKDLIHIFHPDLMPDYIPTFYQQLH